MHQLQIVQKTGLAHFLLHTHAPEFISSLGRRPPLLLGLFGLLVYQMLQLVNTVTSLMLSIYYIQFMAEVVLGLVGGVATPFIGTMSIITDQSRHELLPVMLTKIDL